MDQHNLAVIRSLVQSAFTAKELWRFCADRPCFHEAIIQFGMNPSLAEMADVLLEYCQTRLLLNELLATIRDVNPRQYDRYQPALFGTDSLPNRQLPHNLPPRSEFVGREQEKARVHEALCSRSYLISIEGIGGIGKTSLALEAAYECLQASQAANPPEGIATFDSFIWATAKDRDLALNALLDAIALTLDYPGIVLRPLENKRFAVEKLLRERPCLLLVDNFESVTDEGVWDMLRSLPEPSKALITTREQKLGQVWSIPVSGLDEAESLALVRSEGCRLDLESIACADEKTLLQLHRATGGAPLAIKWAVGQIKQRGQSLDIVLVALHEARGDLFEDIFARCWSLLSAQARHVLLVMPLFATSGGRKAIEAATGLHHFGLDDAIGQLVEMSLLVCTDELLQIRYGLHPLTRAFATAELRQKPDLAPSAGRQLAEYYAQVAGEYADEYRRRSATAFEQELPNILAVIKWCWAHKSIDLGKDILRDTRWMMIRIGQWNELMILAQQALTIVDEMSAAELKVRPISWIYRHRGNLDAAEEQVLEALQILERGGDREAVARAKRHLGRIAQERGDLARAKVLLLESQTLFRACGSQAEAYWAQTDLAGVEMDLGNLAAAHAICVDILDRVEQTGNPERLAHVLGIMAGVARKRGDLEESERLGHRVLDMERDVNRLDNVADCSYWLAKTEIELGKNQEARQNLARALDIYRTLDMQNMIEATESLLAGLEEGADCEE